MRLARTMILLVILAAPMLPIHAAAQSAWISVQQCESANTHSEEIDCYVEAAAKSRAEVRRTFETTLRDVMNLERQLGDLTRNNGRSLEQWLRTSQSAWLKYSEAQCHVEGQSASMGGSGTDEDDADCRLRLDTSRLAELRATLKLIKENQLPHR